VPNVSFVNAFKLLPYCLRQRLPMDRSASTGLFTTTVAVAVSQFAGLTFNPVDGLASHSGR
jgi:hypothetical protein